MTGDSSSRLESGRDVPSVNDVQVATLVKMGVPRGAISVIAPQQATATEADALAQLALAHSWHRVIVVTSKYHTARARLAFTRRLKDAPVQVIMRGSKYDEWDPRHWAANRVHLRLSLIELQKLLLYWAHVAD